jgi:EpsI family protein
MRSEDRNLMLMAVALIAAGLVSFYFFFKDLQQADTVYVRDFPRTVGAWVSEEIPIPKATLDILETDNAFYRRYRKPNGEEVYLYIIYSQNNDKITHLPENCYMGTGVTFLEETQDIIPVHYRHLTISANRLLFQAGKLYQICFYWFKAGDHFTSDYWKNRMFIALNAFMGQRKGNALIRISADFTKNDQEKAIQEVKEFTDLITPQLFKYLP